MIVVVLFGVRVLAGEVVFVGAAVVLLAEAFVGRLENDAVGVQKGL